MDNLKIALRQVIDIILGVIALILVTIYLIDIGKNGVGDDVNFTGFLLIVVGYVINNIYNKVILINKLIDRNDG